MKVEPRTVGSLTAQLGRGESEPVRIASLTAGQRVVVIAAGSSGEELRAALASLLSLKWTPGAPQEEHSWLLSADEDRLELPGRLRQQATTAGRRELRSRLDLLAAAMRQEDGASERLKGEHPDDWQWISNGVPPATRILAALSAKDVTTLVRGGVWVSPRLESGQPLAAAARAALPGPGMKIKKFDGDGQLIETRAFTPHDSPDAVLHVGADLFGGPDALGIRGGLLNLQEVTAPPGQLGQRLPIGRGNLRLTSVLLPPKAIATGREGTQDDPGLKPTVRLFRPDETEGLSYIQTLERIASLTGFHIASDYYHVTGTRRFPPLRTDTPLRLEELLDQAARVFQFKWRVEGEFLLLRNARWYFEEEGEIPEATLRQVKELARRNAGLSLEDVCGLASRLSGPQFGSLGLVFAGAEHVSRARESHRLFSGLSPAQREGAASEEGLAFRSLSSAHQESFLRVTRSERAFRTLTPVAERQEWRLMLRPAVEGEAAGSLFTCGRLETFAVLPFRLLLPSPSMRRRT